MNDRITTIREALIELRDDYRNGESAVIEILRSLHGVERERDDLADALRALIEWNDRWPSHRIYGSGDIQRVAAEIDAVVLAARAALDRHTKLENHDRSTD